MSPLPPIEPPDDFERTAYVRAVVGGLPSIAPPADFEDAVLRTVHRPRFTTNHLVVLLVALSLVGGLIWWTAAPVTPEVPVAPVAPAPVITAPSDSAAPAAAVAPAADSTKRTAAPKPRPKRAARPKQPVAGY